MTLDDEISPREAARRLGKRYGQIIRLIRSGKLEARKPPGCWGWLVSVESLNRIKANDETSRIPA